MPEYYSGRIILSPSESAEFCEMISHPSPTAAFRRDSHLEKIRSEMEIAPTATGFTLSIPDVPDPKAVDSRIDCTTDNYRLPATLGLYLSFPRKMVLDSVYFGSTCKFIPDYVNFDHPVTFKHEFNMQCQKVGPFPGEFLYNLKDAS